MYKVSDVIDRLKFWREHPHEGLPSYIAQAIEVLEQLQSESDSACEELQRVLLEKVDLFDKCEQIQAENDELKKELKILDALQAAGVDNWESYDSALDLIG